MLQLSSYKLIATDFCGRINVHDLPEQTLMELLVSNIDDHESVLDKNGEYKNISEWDGLKRDDKGNITHIAWSVDTDYYFDLDESVFQPGGSIDLLYLPPHLVQFAIEEMQLKGTVETSTLPRTLEDFHVSANSLSGTFDVAGLPKTLMVLEISKNKFSGSFALADAPQKLVLLKAAGNDFSGSIDLTNLGPELYNLSLQNNAFSGTIDLRKIPKSICYVSLQGNKFAQEELVIEEFDGIRYIYVDKTFGKVKFHSGENVFLSDNYSMGYWTIQMPQQQRKA